MPKTKEQFEQIKKERMATILKAALYLFAVKGYNAVSTDDITNYAKCSHGLLYHYFGSKEDLFHYLMENVVKINMQEIVKNIDFNSKPKFILIDLIDAHLNALKSENDDYACSIYLLLNLHLQKKYIPKPRNKGQQNPFDIAYELIDRGKKEGAFNDFNTKEMLIALISVIKGLAYNRINLGTKFTCPKSEIIARMIIKN